MRMRQFPIVLFLLTGLAVSTAAGAANVKEEFDRTYALRAGGEIKVSNTNGTMTISSWDRDEVRIEATKSVKTLHEDRARELLDDIRIEVSEGEDSLVIETRLPKSRVGLFGWLFGESYNASVSYRLTVPHDVDLGVSTVNGNVKVEAVRGELRAKTTNGRIEIAHAEGAVTASTVNGGIRADFDDLAEDTDVSFRTVNGSIAIQMPDSVAAEVDMRTVNGRVTTDLAIEDETTDRRRRTLRGKINGGGGRLSFRTVNGSIRLESR